ncbi:hypothetical protein ACMXYO_01165 [Neptuniibacter sp. QD37_6]|uniref:hypothetical protein n=1 Tax=Neptuniibacter sp. QD37_6 TaxID=3398210 RepID=UPI0039F58234
MSRWIKQFEEHSFRTSWSNVKKFISDIEKQQTNDPNVPEEVSRLKKVIAYIDSSLGLIEPELTPVFIWDTFRGQSDQLVSQLQNYLNNRNSGHLTNANNHADQVLSIIRPYMVGSANEVESIRAAALGASGFIENQIERLKGESEQQFAAITAYHDESANKMHLIDSFYGRVSSLEDDLFAADGLGNKVRNLCNDSEEKHSKLSEFYGEVFEGEEDVPSIKLSIKQAKEELEDDRQKASEKLDDLEASLNELKKFYRRVFGSSDEAQLGLKDELDQGMDLLESYKVKQEETYAALNKKIESLLPGATSAGLATAYSDMRESFNKPILISNIIFYISLVFLVLGAVAMSVETFWAADSIIKFKEFGNWDSILKGLLYKLPFYGPVLWLAYFASKRRSEAQRLQQEYAHKESLAKSYESFKKQIEDLEGDETEMKKSFILKAVDAITYNASDELVST